MQKLGKTGLEVSRIALGCMRMASLEASAAQVVVKTALENGITFFDHADIYGGGESELRFAAAVNELGIRREEYILQSKCGIRKGYFDFSKEHILTSVDEILKRLGTDYLDVLALHRPDALMEPEEVAEAFSQLKQAGKVRHFGVSNQNSYQMELLQSYLDEPLVVNQLQFSPAHTPLIDMGLHVNMKEDGATVRDGGVLDYCRLKGVTVQAWSPFLIDLQRGIFVDHPDYANLNQTIERLAAQYHVSREAIVVAWILRHPAKIQTIVGSMNPDRLANIAAAEQVTLTRPEWYDIYTSAGNSLP
ncbi:aldo/keto reductase family oxidoreductase [Streptococcus sp. zg-86]|uniref:Aldo/keto reductase family oxidoreductase n=1 Tax=Streptococcus zhangguiae TaxID=2664091 RepID=A0A6I4RGL9_9STRE|nr:MULTISPECIES: aldo/keto reductase [unclassified Streptococcus]MTB63449.1 aldo/keto reductase family oxidoreductase [Streptococcus sp. zg-86]MTB89902.1 aldo/keto reductase family oxidoreductase [Streptococcus sp. zg-36]MWV55573.1 aldo/keto reductase family oxidoreductase [Streptococcus sp. zg-70]QTH47762.1 aldo/keto reductase [Streptococcus sp. zg-86]